ncbi:hypothetical protein AAE02nite_37400 [Adhaeribacter aerolatus]|uniref:Uncharacterized protein n=2 Tax=Adhaeribacter aerolatus TaxID=670289 RepID=A0A512B291_9BACT|nr:hypothetical protein AAE02nite_37400 [Adhaeribacter aerolatus]
MLMQILSRAFIVLDYQLNKDYIGEFLCINQSKPELNCEGHCYLQKNLKKAEQSENKSTQQTLKIDFPLSLPVNFTCSFSQVTPIQTFIFRYLVGHPVRYLAAIFHPPSYS